MIYLDNSATTRPFSDVIETMTSCMSRGFFNPSALYRPAMDVELEMDAVRKDVLREAGAPHGSVIFTSGGTESNNLAIRGTLSRFPEKGRIITSVYEHPSVLEVFRSLELDGWDVVYIPVNADGSLRTEVLEASLTEDTRLVSLMHVNNEIGAVTDLSGVARLIHAGAPKAVFHSDGVQAFGRVPADMDRNGVDLYSFSGHKINASKGIGGLIFRSAVNVRPIIYGGGQEKGIRSGTENVPGILGLGTAVRKYTEHAQGEWVPAMHACKVALIAALDESGITYEVNGPAVSDAAPHILSLYFPGVRGETLLHVLEEQGIYVSTGSACSSHKKGGSHVLEAIDARTNRSESTLRISLSPENTINEMEETAQALAQGVRRLSRFRRR